MQQAASAAQQAAQAVQQANATSAALGSVAPGMQTSGDAGGRNINFGGAASDPDFASDWAKANEEFSKRKFNSTKIADKEFQKVVDSFERRARKIDSASRDERMDSARSAYSGGGSSSSTSTVGSSSSASSSTATATIDPQVNVTTGPIMNIDGQNYVSQEDFIAGLQMASEQGARMALDQIGGNGSSRRTLGVG